MRWFLSLIEVFLSVLTCLVSATGVVLAIATLSVWWLLVGAVGVVAFAFAQALVSVTREAYERGVGE